MEKPVSVAAVICAAGASARMGGIKKEYLELGVEEQGAGSASLTVLGAAALAFASIECVQIIAIVIPKNDEENARRSLPEFILNSKKPEIIFVEGGQIRQASVYNALCALKHFNPCYVLIHDGARPWVSSVLIEKIITEVKKYDAVIPLLPLTDTPKEIGNGESGEKPVFIERHLKRANTGIAQTPQAFKFPEILHAHEKAAQTAQEFTDDAEIWGMFCGKVAAVPGEPENRKITFAKDIE